MSHHLYIPTRGELSEADLTVAISLSRRYPADNSCVKMTPEQDATWQEEDSLDQGRTMGQFIILPDGRLWMGNGGALGTAGYGNESCASIAL